ncbi:MAG: DUF3999 domain-containing protein [Pseudoxanthomonas sp.]
MKVLALIALLPLAAIADTREDYAQQWPLTLAEQDAGAYRVVLDRSVYQQVQSSTLKDLVVVNAEGGEVAASLFDAEQPLARPSNSVEVPWFPLPSSNGGQVGDIASISEIGADGSLRRVVMNGTGSTAVPASGDEYLIDTSRLHEPVRALRITWVAGQAPFDRAYRVTASDDLKTWRAVQEEGHLIELQNNGARIFENRIALSGVQAKYLRLEPLQKGQRPLALSAVSAEFAPAQVVQGWEWEDISGTRVVEKDGTVSFQYEVRGRFPFERADVVVPGNSSNEWILKSRDDQESEWGFAAAPWMAFRLQGGNGDNRSPPQALGQLNRDRYWRLLPRSGASETPPTLRLGYRPEVLVFLAQGKTPYALLAGSARAQRAQSPLPQLVDALRLQRGQDWQPATATLGAMQASAGAAALTPGPVQRDWKAWLLWALLVGGALIVAGFAFSLLKKPERK